MFRMLLNLEDANKMHRKMIKHYAFNIKGNQEKDKNKCKN